MHTIYLSSAYLAPIEYYTKLADKESIIFIEQHDNYQKQSYRNRCKIAGPNEIIDLTIPTVKPDTLKCPMKDIRISDHGNWRHLHWNAILSAYNTTPFFDYYRDEFQPFYEKKYDFLVDFNEELRQLICQLIDIHPEVNYTESYHTEFSANEQDFRDIIHPKKDYTVYDPEFISKTYYQVFDIKKGFRPNLSIIDLLFNMGPESIFYLK